MAISWCPSVQMLRHGRITKVIMPIGSMLNDFRLETIKYDKYDITMEFLHKDHFLLTNRHDLSSHIKFSDYEVKRPVFLS